MISKKCICGILFLLCLLTLTYVSAADNQTSTDNYLAMGTSNNEGTIEQSTGMNGYDTSSLKNFSGNKYQTNTSSTGNSNSKIFNTNRPSFGFGNGSFDLSRLNLSTLNISSINSSSFNFGSLNFTGMNSSGLDLSKLNISSIGNGSFNLSGLNTTGLNFSDLNFSTLNLSTLNFSSLNLSGLNTSSLKFSNSSNFNLSSLNLSSLNFSSIDLSKLNFTGMNSSRFNMSKLNLSSLDLSSLDLSHLNLSSLFNKNKANDTTDEPVVAPDKPVVIQDNSKIDDKKPVKKTVKNTSTSKDKSTSHVKKIAQTTTKAFTIKRTNDSVVLYQGDSIVTLDELNKIFDTTFSNGHLVLYINDEVVFNGTVTDDLASVIFEIIEKFIGEHEIKVEFTNNNNETKTYAENVTIN